MAGTPLPVDFRKKSPSMTVTNAAIYWKVSREIVYRWYRKTEITPAKKDEDDSAEMIQTCLTCTMPTCHGKCYKITMLRRDATQ